MEPQRFEETPAHQVIGVERRIILAQADWSDLWNRQYAPRMGDVDAASTGGPCTGYYFASGTPGTVDFLMGKPAQPGAALPEDLAVRDVPATTCAVFECDMKSIGETWAAIYRDWLPRSGWVENESAPAREAYGPGCMSGAEPVVIYIPVRRA